MGLNLVEHSSGTYQGQLRISKRGSPRVRQWLYMAVLRLIRRAGVADWYRGRKRHGAVAARKALVAVMRKLAVALYRVGVEGVAFEARKLFAARPGRQRARREPGGPRISVPGVANDPAKEIPGSSGKSASDARPEGASFF